MKQPPKRLYAMYRGKITRDPTEYEILHRLEEEHQLQVGELYVVSNVDMSKSITYVNLQGVGASNLNSIMFKFFTMEKGSLQEHDIYSDPTYNPYLEPLK